jgi:hypothetical protein
VIGEHGRLFRIRGDGVLQAGMALGALATGAHEIRSRPFGFDAWPSAIDKCRSAKRKEH